MITDYLKSLTDGAAGFRAEDKQVKKLIEKKKRRREDLRTMPPSKAEVVADMQQLVDSICNRTVEHTQRTFDGVISNPLEPVYERQHFALLGNPYAEKDNVRQSHLLMLLAPAIKDSIPGLLDRLDWPTECGPPRAERLEEIAKLDAGIGELELREQQLIDEAAAALNEIKGSLSGKPSKKK